jgi:LysR family glycine cleavage system transcriptional activator
LNAIHVRRFRNIPPLQYLLGFEAAARLGSFGKAADELGLTQSAVSHQMRLLEERLGQPLFLRHGRTVRLTDAGRDYQRTVQRSFEELEGGYRRLAPFRKPGSVVIYAPRDFAARWLMPRLADLRQRVPDCDPWIDTSGIAVDFNDMEVSIAIHRGAEANIGVIGHRLANDVLAPVMSPQLAGSPLAGPADLPRYPLLHTEGSMGWKEWFEHFGIAAGDVSAGLDFSDADLALDAAERGLGIALASQALAAEAIANGRLAQSLEHSMETAHAWFATTTAKELDDPVTRAVWSWISDASSR